MTFGIVSFILNFFFISINQSINQSIHWHEQTAVIPCRSQEPPPFLPILHFFLPLLSANHSSILPHFIQPSISWSTSWSYCFQIHVQYSFGNPIFFHSLYMFFISMVNQIIYLLSEIITLRQTEATMPPKRYRLFIKLHSVKYHNSGTLTPLFGPELLQKSLLLKRQKLL